MNQSDLRNEIQKIRANHELSTNDKNKLIQDVMNKNNKTNNNLRNHDIKDCTHYPNKNCNYFYFSCCNKFAHCIRCHNEIDNDHKPNLINITCANCKLFQKPSNQCTKCNIIFNKNYCSICYIWTDKDIYHCDQCGLCRVGKKDASFHCTNCETCFDISNIKHQCKTNISYKDKTCGFCLENIYDSQIPVHTLSCNHFVHIKCFKNATENDQYKCPVCRKSMFNVDWTFLRNMISIQPMPEDDIIIGTIVSCKYFGKMKVLDIYEHGNMYYGELFEFGLSNKVYGSFYKNDVKKLPKMVNIICNDCNEKSNVKYHYLGCECYNCGSFNVSID
jgi:RING finger/CHY zinc finger protein 1